MDKYISFNINNKLAFIDSFQFLSSSLDTLVKNLCKVNFNYLSQEYDSEVLGLGKQKEFYSCEYKSSFEMFKEMLQSKFYSSLNSKNISDKCMDMHLNFRIDLK